MTTLRGALEENILTVLVWHEIHATEVMLRVPVDLFSTRSYRDIAKQAIAYIEKYGRPPRAHIYDLLEDRLRKGEDGKLMRLTLDAMKELEPHLQIDYVLAELDKFIRLRKLNVIVERAADAIGTGDVETAERALADQDVSDTTQTSGIVFADPQQSLKFLDNDEAETFSSGIAVLDEKGVRPRRKTVMMLIAPKKKGKSWFLINMARHAIANGQSVLYVTMELSQDDVSERMCQAFFAMTTREQSTIRVPIFTRDSSGHCTTIDFDTIEANNIEMSKRGDLARNILKFKKRAPLIIKEFPNGALTLSQLRGYLDYLKRTQNFTPDILIMDMLDNMQLSATNLRIETGRIYQGFRGLCIQRNVAGVVVTQGNRSSDTAKIVKGNQVAEDFSKLGTVDIALTYSQTDEERDLNLARIFVDAARKAPDKFTVLISQSYATGQFCLDSTYMGKVVEREKERLTGNLDDGEEET